MTGITDANASRGAKSKELPGKPKTWIGNLAARSSQPTERET
jgi:hypothetical protein